MPRSVFLVAAIPLALLPACSSRADLRKGIVGTWLDGKDAATRLTFAADGSFNYRPADKAACPLEGKYRWLDDGRLEAIVAGAPPGTARVSAPGWIASRLGDLQSLQGGRPVTTTATVSLSGQELKLTGAGLPEADTYRRDPSAAGGK
jgi:hypothetical protein